MLNNIVLFSSDLNASIFDGLSRVEYLSLADNALPDILHVKGILRHMPALKTIDLGRIGLQEIHEDDFRVTSLSFITFYFLH